MQRMKFDSCPGADGRLDAWLASKLPEISRSRLQRLIREGRVRMEGAPARPSSRIHPGMRVEIDLPAPRPIHPQPREIDLKLVFEDEDILVIDKPPGLVVHPAPGHADGTLVNALLHYCPEDMGKMEDGGERPGIVHRLDKDTSGLLVVARNEKARLGLIEQFKGKRVKKDYLALVHGRPAPSFGRIESGIGRRPGNRKLMGVVPLGGKPAVSEYRLLQALEGNTSLLRVRISTGRTHQIRVHMAHIGHPVLGDPLYGSRKRDGNLSQRPPRQMLHAWKLGFEHPVSGIRMNLAADPPEDMQNVLDALAEDR